MGDRRNIELMYETGEKIYLYSHWGGTDMPSMLASALERGRDRWDDEAYLARIIFSEMIQAQVLEDTGYGIAPYPIDEEHPNIAVDLKNKTADGKSFDKYVAYHMQAV